MLSRPRVLREELPDQRRGVQLAAHPAHRAAGGRAARPGVPAALDGVELDAPPVAAAAVHRVADPVPSSGARSGSGVVTGAGVQPDTVAQNPMLRTAESTRPRRRATPPPAYGMSGSALPCRASTETGSVWSHTGARSAGIAPATGATAANTPGRSQASR